MEENDRALPNLRGTEILLFFLYIRIEESIKGSVAAERNFFFLFAVFCFTFYETKI